MIVMNNIDHFRMIELMQVICRNNITKIIVKDIIIICEGIK